MPALLADFDQTLNRNAIPLLLLLIAIAVILGIVGFTIYYYYIKQKK